MNILNLLDKAIEMLDSSSKAVSLFKQLMDLSHKITRAEHPSSEEDVKEYYRVHDELVKEPKEAIARAYQVNTKIPPTTDTNIVAHYYDDAMQYIQKLGYNIDLLRKKATKEEMGKDEGRCWEGYEPVAGVPAYEKGSCQKKMEEVQEVIGMLDKAINFYDPSQIRDERGRWGDGGNSSSSKNPQGESKIKVIGDNAYTVINGALHKTKLKKNGEISQKSGWEKVNDKIKIIGNNAYTVIKGKLHKTPVTKTGQISQKSGWEEVK